MASKRENKRKGIKAKKKGREAAIAAVAAKGPAAGQDATTGGGAGEGSDTAGVVRKGVVLFFPGVRACCAGVGYALGADCC